MLKKILLSGTAFLALAFSYNAKAQDISLNSVMLDSQTGNNLGATSQQGNTSNIFQAQKQMVYHVMRKLDIDPDTLPPDIRANIDRPQTTSVAALTTFSEGVAAMDSGNFADAKKAFAEAVSIDPNFQTAAKLQSAMPDFNASDIMQKQQQPESQGTDNVPNTDNKKDPSEAKGTGQDAGDAGQQKADDAKKNAPKNEAPAAGKKAQTPAVTEGVGTNLPGEKADGKLAGTASPLGQASGQTGQASSAPASLTEIVSSSSGKMVHMAANNIAGAAQEFGNFDNANNFGAFGNAANFDLQPQGPIDDPMMPNTVVTGPMNPEGVPLMMNAPLAFDEQGNVIGFIDMEGNIVSINDEQAIMNFFIEGEEQGLVEGNLFSGGFDESLFNIKGLAIAFIQQTNASNETDENMGPYITTSPVILNRNEEVEGMMVQDNENDNGKLYNLDQSQYYLQFGPNETLLAYSADGHQNLNLDVQNEFNVQGSVVLPRGEFVGMGYVSSSPWLSDDGNYTVEYYGGRSWMVAGVETPVNRISNDLHMNNAVHNYGGVATATIVKSDTAAMSIIGAETAVGTFGGQINFGTMKLNNFVSSGLTTDHYEASFSGTNISVNSDGSFYDNGTNFTASVGDVGLSVTAPQRAISGSVFGSYAEGIGGVYAAGRNDAGLHSMWGVSGAFIGEMQ